jgi:predicted nucleic acid-binding protein
MASHLKLDNVNVFVALLTENHIHHGVVTEWFNASPRLQWAICPFTEAGFLRNATAARPGQIEMSEATAVLARIAQHTGYVIIPSAARALAQSTPLSVQEDSKPAAQTPAG